MRNQSDRPPLLRERARGRPEGREGARASDVVRDVNVKENGEGADRGDGGGGGGNWDEEPSDEEEPDFDLRIGMRARYRPSDTADRPRGAT